MSNPLKQSLKERLKSVAKERNLSFNEVWHNYLLERFLERLCQSKYKKNFILKGGTLLARYISIGRETKDLDFLVERLKNTVDFMSAVFDHICGIPLEDGFEFEKVKIKTLQHPHMDYTGIEVLVLAKLGGNPEASIQIDLGFGDLVEPIIYSLDLTPTSKGTFKNIHVRSYPKEFIFAEKLETVIRRDVGNSRMKDFHDLYSLTSFADCLNPANTEKVVRDVFQHRKTPLSLPIKFDDDSMEILQSTWQNYQRNLFPKNSNSQLPKTIVELIRAINSWLKINTSFDVSSEGTIRHVYLPLGKTRLYHKRFVDLNSAEVISLNNLEDHLFEPLSFNKLSNKWEVKYEHDKTYEVVVFYLSGDSGREFVSHDSKNLNREHTKLERARLGDIYHVPGYFLNDWNNRVDSSGILHYWFQPLSKLSHKIRKKVIEKAKSKHPYNTFD